MALAAIPGGKTMVRIKIIAQTDAEARQALLTLARSKKLKTVKPGKVTKRVNRDHRGKFQASAFYILAEKP